MAKNVVPKPGITLGGRNYWFLQVLDVIWEFSRKVS